MGRPGAEYNPPPSLPPVGTPPMGGQRAWGGPARAEPAGSGVAATRTNRSRGLTPRPRFTIIRRLPGGVPERSKGSDCKSDGSAFEGSNPSPSTTGRAGAGERTRSVLHGRLINGVGRAQHRLPDPVDGPTGEGSALVGTGGRTRQHRTRVVLRRESGTETRSGTETTVAGLRSIVAPKAVRLSGDGLKAKG